MSPEPEPGTSGESYIDDTAYINGLFQSWQFEWLAPGEAERDLEVKLFGWRPLG